MAGILGIVEQTESLSALAAGPVAVMKPITVLSGAGVVAKGTVLGMVTLTHKYVPLDLAGVDGSEVARGILVEEVDATLADVGGHLYCLGEFRLSKAIWPVGITDAQKLVALQQLQESGMIFDVDDLG